MININEYGPLQVYKRYSILTQILEKLFHKYNIFWRINVHYQKIIKQISFKKQCSAGQVLLSDIIMP